MEQRRGCDSRRDHNTAPAGVRRGEVRSAAEREAELDLPIRRVEAKQRRGSPVDGPDHAPGHDRWPGESLGTSPGDTEGRGGFIDTQRDQAIAAGHVEDWRRVRGTAISGAAHDAE